jgi:hypothetical protein
VSVKWSKSTPPIVSELYEVMNTPTSWVAAAVGTVTVAIRIQFVPSVE